MIHIRIENLSFSYEKEVLKDISIEIKAGQIFALIGPVGSGKTTLLRLLNLLDSPSSGKICFDDVEISSSPSQKLEMRRKTSLVFQKPVMFNASVFDNVAYPLKLRNYQRRHVREMTERVLEDTGLIELAGRNARALSGGEVQRVAFARAIVTNPHLLLLDEPTANCDRTTINLIEQLTMKLNHETGTTIVLATHAMDVASRLAGTAAVLIDGRVVSTGSIYKILNLTGTELPQTAISCNINGLTF